MSKPAHVTALLSPDLTPVDYRVWAYLHWRQGKNGKAWPSQKTIADDLGMKPDGIRKITKRLANRGWLTIVRPERNGRGRHLRYHVTCPEETQPAIYLSDKETQPAVEV